MKEICVLHDISGRWNVLFVLQSVDEVVNISRSAARVWFVW